MCSGGAALNALRRPSNQACSAVIEQRVQGKAQPGGSSGAQGLVLCHSAISMNQPHARSAPGIADEPA